MLKAGSRLLRLARASAVLCSIGAISAAGCGGKTDIGGLGEGDGVTPQGVIRDVCAELAAIGCVAALGGERECISTISEQRDVAFARGCAGQFDALLECLSTKPVVCRGGLPETTQCEAESLAVSRCANTGGAEECSVSGGGSGGAGGGEFCTMECADFGFQCQRQGNEPLLCECTFGPNAGFTFSQVSCEQAPSGGQKVCGR